MSDRLNLLESANRVLKEMPDALQEHAFKFLTQESSNSETPNLPLAELCSFARGEYSALRGEINERISLQNGALQRVLSLFGITATIGVAFFAALVRTRESGDEAQLLSAEEVLLLGKALWVLSWVFAVITLLLICNWVYQLWLIFRLHEYTNWIASEVESKLGVENGLIYGYSRHGNNQPWAVRYDRARFRYLQVLVLYSFALLSFGVMGIVGLRLWSDTELIEKWIGATLASGALGALLAIMFVHIDLHRVPDHVTRLP